MKEFIKYNAGRIIASESTNNDLYHELFSTCLKKAIDLSIDWMPSHLDDPDNTKTPPTWVTERDIAGNKCADELADQAADEYKVGLQNSN